MKEPVKHSCSSSIYASLNRLQRAYRCVTERNPLPTRLNSFAYVDLPSSEAVTRAVSLSESHLDGRRLLIKPGNDFAGRPALPDISLPGTGAKGDDEVAMPGKQGKTGLTKTAQRILRAQKNPAAPTLFMGNLSFETTEDNIKEMLERAARAREAWKKGGADGSDDEDSDDGNRRGKKGKGKGKARSSDSAKPEDGAKEDEDSGSGSDSESDSGDESESESDEQSEDENEDGEKKSKKMAAKAKGERKPKKEASDGPRGAGIRKIRMGTFEDTGKCKGCVAYLHYFPFLRTLSSLQELTSNPFSPLRSLLPSVPRTDLPLSTSTP